MQDQATREGICRRLGDWAPQLAGALARVRFNPSHDVDIQLGAVRTIALGVDVLLRQTADADADVLRAEITAIRDHLDAMLHAWHKAGQRARRADRHQRA